MAVSSVVNFPVIPELASASIAAFLLRAATRHFNSGLIIASADNVDQFDAVPYPELLREAQQILGGLDAPRGRPIALLLDRPRDFIPAFWACVLGGYVACPLAPVRNDPQRWARHLSHVDALLERPLFISTGALLDELPSSLSTVDLQVLRRGVPQEQVHDAQSSDAAVFMLTSGSTGNSKAVELTHGNLLASMSGRAQRQQLTSADITFNWIAFDHVAALLESHMIALHVGATQLHCEPATVLTDPLNFLRLIDRHRVTLAFAPNFLLGQINSAVEVASGNISPEGNRQIDLACLRRIVTGGEANLVETGRRFLDRLAPYGLARNALWPAFGMTETCAASVYSHEFPDRDAKREFASVGLPLSGLEIRIVDEHGHLCPSGEAGELQLRGPMIFRRYHNNEEATRTAFATDRWFRTGDVGRLDDGWLSLVARNKDSIIVNGVNYFSHELETKLEQLDGVEASCVAAFPVRPKGADTERLVVAFAATLASSDEEGLYQLLVAVRNTTIMLWGFRPAIILPLPTSAFPKTSLGKIQRSLMRKRLEAGEFSATLREVEQLISRQAGAYVVPEGRLETAIAAVFAGILGVDQPSLSATASFFDLGGTSLDILKLTRSLERRCGFTGGLPIVLQNPSVRQLALHISSQTQRTPRIYDPIVPLQLSGRKTPLFCVHPGNGEVFSLVNVAKYFLNDRPFLALRPPGFNDGEEYFTNVRRMIDSYVDAIVRTQPQGPYAIAGYSLGCSIAYEVAKELGARGREVAFLAAIDGRPRREARKLWFNMATGLALVIDLISRARYDELNKELVPKMPSREVCQYVFKFADSARVAELDLDQERFTIWARVAHSVESMLYEQLVNTGKLDRMTIFRSEGYSARYWPEWSSTELWRKELTGWDGLATETRYIDMPGQHFTIMGPKHVSGFQAMLRAEIDRALAGR